MVGSQRGGVRGMGEARGSDGGGVVGMGCQTDRHTSDTPDKGMPGQHKDIHSEGALLTQSAPPPPRPPSYPPDNTLQSERYGRAMSRLKRYPAEHPPYLQSVCPSTSRPRHRSREVWKCSEGQQTQRVRPKNPSSAAGRNATHTGTHPHTVSQSVTSTHQGRTNRRPPLIN